MTIFMQYVLPDDTVIEGNENNVPSINNKIKISGSCYYVSNVVEAEAPIDDQEEIGQIVIPIVYLSEN